MVTTHLNSSSSEDDLPDPDALELKGKGHRILCLETVGCFSEHLKKRYRKTETFLKNALFERLGTHNFLSLCPNQKIKMSFWSSFYVLSIEWIEISLCGWWGARGYSRLVALVWPHDKKFIFKNCGFLTHSNVLPLINLSTAEVANECITV